MWVGRDGVCLCPAQSVPGLVVGDCGEAMAAESRPMANRSRRLSMVSQVTELLLYTNGG